MFFGLINGSGLPAQIGRCEGANGATIKGPVQRIDQLIKITKRAYVGWESHDGWCGVERPQKRSPGEIVLGGTFGGNCLENAEGQMPNEGRSSNGHPGNLSAVALA